MADDSGRNSPATSEESTRNDDGDDTVVTRCRSKKRVQFHSDENLVRIREISPRGEQQTTDEEDSGCSEDDDDDDDDEDDDDTWTSGDTGKASSNIPVIVNNAVKLDNVTKGSYEVTKTKGKGSHIVAQITGMSASNSSKLRQKRTVNKDRKTKKTKSPEKTDSPKLKPKSGKKKLQKRTDTEKPVLSPKKSKEPKISKPSLQNTNRTSQSRPPGRSLSPLKKTPPKHEPEKTVVSSLPNGFDNHIRSTSIALQNMSVGKVYTMDGFIFPSDPSDQIKAKSVSEKDPEVSKSEISKSVLQRKKCYAWHMANSDQQDVLFGTPCILPLWDNVQSYTSVAKTGVRLSKRY